MHSAVLQRRVCDTTDANAGIQLFASRMEQTLHSSSMKTHRRNPKPSVVRIDDLRRETRSTTERTHAAGQLGAILGKLAVKTQGLGDCGFYASHRAVEATLQRKLFVRL